MVSLLMHVCVLTQWNKKCKYGVALPEDGWCQAITWTKAPILAAGASGKKKNQWIIIEIFSHKLLAF